jgi:regulator of sirC expression with transglutaminase-like and TPR domain
MKEDNKINALIKLLDDPDEQIYSQIKDELISIGGKIIPRLEVFWEEHQYELNIQERVEEIVHKIQFETVLENIKEWIENPAKDLIDGAVCIAKYQYPDIDSDKVRDQINRIRNAVWLELSDELTSYEKVNILNRVMYDEFGFRGNKKNFHSPQNSFINDVLDTKKGNPLSLSIIYSYVAQSLDVPIYGVNLPNHFVLAYVDKDNILELMDHVNKDDEILFYINVFSRGTIFSKSEIDKFLKQLEIDKNEHFYQPCSNTEIIKRMLVNLLNSYTKLGFEDKIAELQTILNLFK